MFTSKEIKLIEKALLNQKMGKGEEKTVESIYNKLNTIKENDKSKSKA
jgi:hypothetical protein